jgi:hypothetical protein
MKSVAHCLGQVIDIASELRWNGRGQVRADVEVARGARLLYPSVVLWDDLDVRPETIWRRAIDCGTLTVGLLVRAIETLDSADQRLVYRSRHGSEG